MRNPLAVSMVLAAAACGEPQATFVDAAVVAPDASPDAGFGPATVTVNYEAGEPTVGEPIADTQVFFIRPDGTYQVVRTGADGRATADVVPGSTIIAARVLSATVTHLTAYAGVEPGFEVVTGGRPLVRYQRSGRVALSWPAVAGATLYRLGAPCATGYPLGTTVNVDLQPSCPHAASSTIVVTAHRADGATIAYSVMPDVNLPSVAGTSLTMPAFQTNLATASVTFTMVPAEVSEIDAVLTLGRDGAAYGTMRHTNVPTTGATLAVSGPIAPIGTRTAIYSELTPTGQRLPIVYRREQAGPQLASTIELGPNLMPFSTYPSFDPHARTVAWSGSGGGPGKVADVVTVRGHWTVGGRAVQVPFTLVGPALDSHLTLPPLPAELASLVPMATDTGSLSEVFFIDVVGKRDYAAVVHDVVPESAGLPTGDAYRDEPELFYAGSWPQ